MFIENVWFNCTYWLEVDGHLLLCEYLVLWGTSLRVHVFPGRGAPCLVTWRRYSLMESLSEHHHTHTHTQSAAEGTRLLIALQCSARIAKLPPLPMCQPKQNMGEGQKRTQWKSKQGSKHNSISGPNNYRAEAHWQHNFQSNIPFFLTCMQKCINSFFPILDALYFSYRIR